MLKTTFKLIIASIIFLNFNFAIAQEADENAYISAKTIDGITYFFGCVNKDKCKFIGEVNGYDFQGFDASPKLRKTLAVALGITEVGVITAGTLFVVYASFLWTFPTGVSLSTSALAPITGYGISKVKVLNPFHHFRVANISEKILESEDGVEFYHEVGSKKNLEKYIVALTSILDKAVAIESYYSSEQNLIAH